MTSRLLLARVALEYTYKEGDRVVKRIKRRIEQIKSRLNYYEEYKRNNLYVWILSELDKESIFIASNKCYHEIHEGDRKR